MIPVQGPNRDERLTELRRADCPEETGRAVKHKVSGTSSADRAGRRLHNPANAGTGLARPACMPRRLLAVVDATERSRRVLDYVIGYAASVGPVEAVVLNVQTDSDGNPGASPDFAKWPPLEIASKRIIKSATRRLNGLGVVHKSRVEAGDPAQTIARCAHEERCDMIILDDCPAEGVLDEPPQARSRCEDKVSEEVLKLTSVPVVIAR